VMDVQARLFLREDIERLGIAPLTSMFWFGENNPAHAPDWRPKVHDSDGLQLWTGADERIWRPLNNPKSLQVNAFVDDNPKGFGLMQRDQDFENYHDDGVFYDRRPSLWVEPLSSWGEGAVQLVAIPTDDEIHDNIVAFWVPKADAKRGSEWAFDYRLHWLNGEPYPAELGLVVATRQGARGVPGQPRPKGKYKFAVDFEGGPLDDYGARNAVEPVVTASRGVIEGAFAVRVVGTNRWRVMFDVAAAGNEPVDLRAYLKIGDRALTETWLYQYFPDAKGGGSS
jgi:periplasmic glucans biosynthesis protein